MASLDGLGYVVDYFDRGSYGREDPVEVGRLRAREDARALLIARDMPILRDGENGVLVDGGDPGAIAVALRELLGNQELRTAMGQRGFEMASDWGWAARAAAFLRLCRG